MKHIFTPRLAACMAAVLLLSACSGSLAVNELTQLSTGNHLITDRAKQGQMETVVKGSLFGADTVILSETVTDAMPGTYLGPEMTFVPTSDKNPLDIRVVFLVNSPHGMNARELCIGADINASDDASDSGVLRMAGGLCKGSQVIRSATAIGPKPQSLDDPAFTSFVAALTAHLMAIRNTDRGGCDDSNCS